MNLYGVLQVRLLSNIDLSSGNTDQTLKVYTLSSFEDIIIEYIQCYDHNLKEQASWALGNFLSEILIRERLRERGIIKLMLKTLETKNETLASVSCWAISNILRDEKSINEAISYNVFDILNKLLKLKVIY